MFLPPARPTAHNRKKFGSSSEDDLLLQSVRERSAASAPEGHVTSPSGKKFRATEIQFQSLSITSRHCHQHWFTAIYFTLPPYCINTFHFHSKETLYQYQTISPAPGARQLLQMRLHRYVKQRKQFIYQVTIAGLQYPLYFLLWEICCKKAIEIQRLSPDVALTGARAAYLPLVGSGRSAGLLLSLSLSRLSSAKCTCFLFDSVHNPRVNHKTKCIEGNEQCNFIDW